MRQACTEIIRFSSFVLRGRPAPSGGAGDLRPPCSIDIIGISALGSFGQFGLKGFLPAGVMGEAHG
jgi:hypothetical protein